MKVRTPAASESVVMRVGVCWRLALLGGLALIGCGSATERKAGDGAADAGTSSVGSVSSGGASLGGGGASVGGAAGTAPGGGMAGGQNRTFDLNDVSFLFPLPSWSARDALLAADTTGEQGPLVPRSLYQQVAPVLVQSGPVAPSDLYASLRVVGVRVDPCFPADASAAPACMKQVRLVLQPVIQDVATSELTTLDAAVHALFNLSDSAWTSLLVDLGSLQDLAGGLTREAPLAVHPVLQEQGLAGSYATALRTLVLKYAGEATLGELAFMELTKKDASWNFSKVTRQGASFSFIDVPLTSAKLQSTSVILLDSSTEPSRTIVVSPVPENAWVSRLVDLSESASSAEASIREALLTDNPTGARNPQTVDCGSCHLATRNRAYTERARGIETNTWPERFVERGYDLSRVDDIGDDPRSLRSFGYFGTKSSIAGRAIHESAVIARALSR